MKKGSWSLFIKSSISLIRGSLNQVSSTGKASINLDDIEEVTLGHVSDTFNGLSKDPVIGNVDVHHDKCFTIKFKDNTPDLDLVAEDKLTRDELVNLLNHLLMTLRSLEEQKKYEKYVSC